MLILQSLQSKKSSWDTILLFPILIRNSVSFFLTVPWFSLTWFTVKQTIKITVKYADRVRLYPSSQIPLQTERYVHSKVDKTEVLHRFSPTFLRFSSTGFRRTLAPARWEVNIDLRVVRG